MALVNTAVSGGSFAQYLREAARGGGGRLALDVERLRMDFSLPARNGRGRPLTAGELRELLDRESPAVFFSQDLCARYFTYTRDGETHFVLFDDADTLRQKLRPGTPWASPPPFSCTRRCGTCCRSCSAVALRPRRHVPATAEKSAVPVGTALFHQ